jgi:hypothetical protein
VTLESLARALEVTAASLTQSEQAGGVSPWSIQKGIVVVPISRRAGGQWVPTGEVAWVSAKKMQGRRRLQAARLSHPGMAPEVDIGDIVVYDPDVVEPEDGVLVLFLRADQPYVAWWSQRNGVARYRFHDGSWLPSSEGELLGQVVAIEKEPSRRPTQPGEW